MKKANILLAVVNLLVMVYLIFRLGIPYVNSSNKFLDETNSIGVFLAAQANQFAMLQTMLSMLGIGLAVAAFWGYMEIRGRAEQIAKEIAEKTVNATVPTLFDKMLEKFSKEQLQHMIHEAMPTKPPQQNMNEVFLEEIEVYQKESVEMD